MNNLKKINIVVIMLMLFVIFTIIPNSVIAAGTSGTTIVLNPGHGGTYTGCSNGEKKLVEKDITLKIANYLKNYLDKYYNVNVILTHNGQKFPNDDPGDLAARAMIARNNNADLYVSLHIDDIANPDVNGATVYVTSRTELPKYKQGMTQLGNKILANLNKLGIKSNGVINNKLCNDHVPQFQYYDGSQADYYADIRYCMKGDEEGYGDDFSDGSGIPAVLVEHCYMNNSHDVQFLDSEQDLQKLAKADCDAIVDYLDLKLPSEAVATISLDRDNINIQKGAKLILSGTTAPKNTKINWTSSNSQIATIDENGQITAVSEGTVTITGISSENANVSKSIIVTVMNVDLPETTKMNMDKYEVNNDKMFISKIGPNIKTADFLNSIEITENIKVEVILLDKNQEYIGTNTKVIFSEKTNNVILNEYECLIYGDVDGDGEITARDYTLIKNHIMEVKLIKDKYMSYASDVDNDNDVTARDYTLIKNHIMEVKTINLR